MSSKRETSLRQLIYMCNKEVLKEQGLTRTELHEITNYVLDHAAVQEFGPDLVSITDGSILGIGEENKDRILRFPRFMVYSFGKINPFEFVINSDCKRTFRLQSSKSFENFENLIRFTTADTIVAIIDGEIVKYEKNNSTECVPKLTWGIDTHVVTYVLDDTEEKEVLRSKRQLEVRILELVEQGAEEIQAYDIIEGESLHFEVSKTVYTTRPGKLSDDGDMGLMWVREVDEDFEEDDWNPRGSYF